MTMYGCSLETVPSSADDWRTYVWAEHGAQNRDWRMFLGEHRGKDAREKAMQECDRWMRKISKRVDQHQSVRKKQ